MEMPKLNPINFKAIEENSKRLEKEFVVWSEKPLSFDEMVEMYKRIHKI